jgi:hypothetical protein
MAKRKKLTLIEKQTEAHLYYYYLNFIEPIRFRSDFWEAVGYRTYMAPNHLKNFREVIEQSLEQDNPITFLKKKLNYDLYKLFYHLADVPVSEKNPIFVTIEDWDAPKPRYCLDLRYSDTKILEALDREIGNLKKKQFMAATILKKGNYLAELDWRPQLSDSPAVEVVRVPGQCPGDLDLDLPLGNSSIALKIDFSAGKVEIQKAVKTLLKKLGPRDTEPDTRFGPKQIETRRLGYEIYRLNERNLSFEQIALQIGKPLSTVRDLHRRAWEHIHQKERSTKRARRQDNGEEYPFDDDLYYVKNGRIVWKDQIDRGDGRSIEGHNMPSLDDVAWDRGEFYSSKHLGGPGARHTPSEKVDYEDEESTFFDWKSEYAERGKAFDRWSRRYGRLSECIEPHPGTDPFVKGYAECKRVPGSEGCSGCYQAIPRVYYAKDLKAWRIEPGKAVPRKGKKCDTSHYANIENVIRLGVTRGQELELQAKYISETVITECPDKVAKGFGPRWGLRIKYWPNSQVPCVECNLICDNGLCEDVWKWLNKNFRISRKKFNNLRWTDLMSTYTPSFSIRYDRYESAMIALVDAHRAKKSSH